jgi:hypothetical protein
VNIIAEYTVIDVNTETIVSIIEVNDQDRAGCTLCGHKILGNCTIVGIKHWRRNQWTYYCRVCVTACGNANKPLKDSWFQASELLNKYPCDLSSICNAVHITHQLVEGVTVLYE